MDNLKIIVPVYLKFRDYKQDVVYYHQYVYVHHSTFSKHIW